MHSWNCGSRAIYQVNELGALFNFALSSFRIHLRAWQVKLANSLGHVVQMTNGRSCVHSYSHWPDRPLFPGTCSCGNVHLIGRQSCFVSPVSTRPNQASLGWLLKSVEAIGAPNPWSKLTLLFITSKLCCTHFVWALPKAVCRTERSAWIETFGLSMMNCLEQVEWFEEVGSLLVHGTAHPSWHYLAMPHKSCFHNIKDATQEPWKALQLERTRRLACFPIINFIRSPCFQLDSCSAPVFEWVNAVQSV